MQIAKLYNACRRSWDADTSYNEDYAQTVRSTSAERSYGQCAVTSLVVHDHHPGQFFQATVCWNGTCVVHYWIESRDFGQLDFTWAQFPAYAARTNIAPVARARLLPAGNQWMRERYDLLSGRVAHFMKSEIDDTGAFSFSSTRTKETAILS